MNEYAKNYNQSLEYGSIDGYDYLSLDKRIKNASAENKLRIALLLPLSGNAKIVGEALLNSAQLSLFQNHKNNIILKVYDTQGTDFGAVDAMNKAIKDGIDTVVGPLFYAETKAIADIATKNNIVVFSLSNEQKLQNTNSVFVTGSIIEQEIEVLLSKLVDEGKTNFIAFLPNNAYGSTVSEILKRKTKDKDAYLINTEFYTQNTESFEAKLVDLLKSYRVSDEFLEEYEQKKIDNQITGEKSTYIATEEDKIYPDALIIVDGEKVIKNVGMVMYKNQKISKNIQLVATSKIDSVKSLESYSYLDNMLFVGSDPKKYNEYYELYSKVYGNSPLKITSIIYDLIDNIDKFYTKKNGYYLINKTKLLNPYGYDGIDGKFRFLPNGLVERNYYLLQLKDKQKVLVNEVNEFLNY